MRRSVLLGFLLLALGVLGFASWPASGVAAESIESHNVAPIGEEAADRAGSAGATNDGDARRRAVSGPPAQPEARSEGVWIHGTIVVDDQEGREHATTDGELRIDAFDARVGAIPVQVTGGGWRARVRGNLLRLTRATLAGRPVLLQSSERSLPDPLPEGFVVRLRGRWLYPASLRIRDAVTKRDLREVTVTCEGPRYRAWRYPGELEAVCEGVASPIELPSDGAAEARTYWVRAPGYAWRRVEMSHLSRGERSVFLTGGGALAVKIVGFRVPERAFVRLKNVSAGISKDELSQRDPQSVVVNASPLFEREERTAAGTVFEGLRPGGYLVQVTTGRYSYDSEVYGRALAFVEAGRRATVTIRTEKLARPDPVPVEGILRLPEGWETAGVQLEFHAMGDTRTQLDGVVRIALQDMLALGRGDYRFQIEKLVPGTYQARVVPIEVRRRVAIGADGASDLRIEAPLAADVEVTVVDSDTRRTIAVPNIGWRGPLPSGVNSYSDQPARPGEGGVCRFQAPVGKIRISANPMGYGFEYLDVSLKAGLNRITVPIGRVSGVEVVFKVGKVEVPWRDGCELDLEAQGHDGKVSYWSGNRVAVTQPGDYLLEVGKLRGFKHVLPRRVRLKKGDFALVTVQLEYEK